MRRLLIAAAVAAAIATPALAADVTPPNLMKGGPSSPFLTTAGAGPFFGVGTSAAIASSNVSGNVISVPGLSGGDVSAAGGTIDVDVGYIWGRCILNTWCQVEVDGKYTNIVGDTAVGSISNRWGVTQELDVGADVIQTVLSAFPNFKNPWPTLVDPTSLLPANVAVANTPRGYIGVKNGDYLIGGNVGRSGGQTWVDAPGLTTGFRWQTLGSNGKPNGGSLKVFADVMWATKGLTLSNVFGAGGAPIITNANADLKTMYVAGVHYDFGF